MFGWRASVCRSSFNQTSSPRSERPHLTLQAPREALPAATILQRPPLAYQDVDLKTLAAALERMCTDGLVVRWYEEADAPGRERQAVYRRISVG